MSHEENPYVAAFNSINQNEDEIREAFGKRAKQDGTIPNESILDLLNDISVILALDCEEAKYFFTQQNKAIPSGFNLNTLKYEQFINLFELWLKQQAKTLGGADPMIEKLGRAGVAMNQVMSSPLKYGTVAPTKPQDNKVALPPKYKENKRLLDLLVNAHKSEFEEIFQEKLMEEGQEKIAVQDCFIFLQDCFYLDGIEIKEHIDADHDFFMSVNSYKRLFKIVEEYFITKGAGPEEFKIHDISLSFDECFKVLDHWFKTNPDVVLVDNRADLNEGAVRKALLATITNYENMLEGASNDVEKTVLQTTIDTLKAQLVALDKGSSPKKEIKSEMDEAELRKREERRVKAIKEIFDYYCSQQLLAGKHSTFDRLDRLANTITLGTFRVFLKCFKLKVDHHKVIELYHKAAALDENLQYTEFIDLLPKIALRAKFAAEEKNHQPRPEIMKDYNPTSYKSDPTYKNHLETEAKRREELAKSKKLPKVVYKDGAVRGEDQLEAVWEHMGLYDGSYRTNLGQVALPFNTHEKQNFRFPTEGLNYKFKPAGVDGKSPEEVQEEVQKRNELRKLIKDLKMIEKSAINNHKNPNNAKGLPPQNAKEETPYGKMIRGKHYGPDISKMSLKKIENIFYGDIRKVDEKFNPHDLIDENDEEDNVFLAEYNIQTEKKKIKDKDAAEKRKLEEYGRIKKAAKGFAINGKYGHIQPSSSPNPQVYMDAEPQGYDNTINYGVPKGSHSSVKNIRTGGPAPTYLDYNDPGNGYNNARSVRNSQVSMPGLSSGYDGYSGGYSGGNARSSSYGAGEEYNVRSPGYNHAMNRANQVENDVRRREQQMMSNIMSIQNSQVQKGLKAAGNRY